MGTWPARRNALRLIAAIMLIPLGLSALDGSAGADEPGTNPDQDRSRGDRLSLADLAAYRAALSGRPTADDARPADPPVPVQFRDLWTHPGTFQGRRVTVRGRVERMFRQGPIGSFPPLVEAWIFSTAGDPFCVVFPLPVVERGHDAGATPPPPAVPQPGHWVRFTGTFLKMIRYTGADGARVVPLIVGDRTPHRAPVEAEGDRSATGGNPRGSSGPGPGGAGVAGSAGGWLLALALALLAAGTIARQHLRGAGRRARLLQESAPDPPLQFIDSPEESPA
ncbi:MAG TPA: hypothetical protein VFF52_12220 [Isosphaeraceae bacterium]|nr:hypothetical protein [Isosphaeraceae bacterium]